MSVAFKSIRQGLAIVGAAIGLTAALGASSQAQTVTLGLIGNSVEYFPVYVAQEFGYLDKAGIKLDIVATGGSSKSAQMTMAGAVHIGSTSWLDAVRAIDSGAPITIVANSLASSTTMMLSAPGIKSVAALKGGRVSVGGPKDITMAWWLALAKQNGLDGMKDVEVVYGGGTPARFAALASGAAQAAVVATPLAFKGMQDGYNNLGILGPLLPRVPYMSWQANKAWADANPKVVSSFIAANNAAIDAIYDPANRDRVIAVLAKAVQVSQEDARQSYELVLSLKGFEKNSEFRDEQIQGVVDQLVEWGEIPPGQRSAAKYADRKFVNAAKTN